MVAKPCKRVDVKKFVQPANPKRFALILQFATKMVKHCSIFSCVWSDCEFVVFLSLLLSFLFICSRLVELISVSFFKTLTSKGLPLKVNKLSIVVIRTNFCVGSDISWKKSTDYMLHSFTLGWACGIFTTPWQKHDLSTGHSSSENFIGNSGGNFQHLAGFVFQNLCSACYVQLTAKLQKSCNVF